MWPGKTKPRTEGFVREWLHVLPSLQSGPDGDCMEKSRTKHNEVLGKGEATAECWDTCGCINKAHLFIQPEVLWLSGALSVFAFPHPSFYSLCLLQHFLFLFSLFSKLFFISLLFFIPFDFPFLFPIPSLLFLFFPSFLPLPNDFPKFTQFTFSTFKPIPVFL